MRERCSLLSELPQGRAEAPPIFPQELSHERFNQSTFYARRLYWLGYSSRLGASATGAGVGQQAFCGRRGR
jgi:hypothetical protein